MSRRLLRPFHPLTNSTHASSFRTSGHKNRPQLRTPPPLTQQGTPVEPVPERSFIQKYWVYIVVALAALGQSIGDTLSGVFWYLTRSSSLPFQSLHQADQRRKEVDDRQAARSSPRYFLSLISNHRWTSPPLQFTHPWAIPRACATVINPDAYLDLLNCNPHHLGRRRTPPPRVSVEDRV